MNYFSSKSAAERYAKGRPYFHPLIVGYIKKSLSLKEPLPSALDVGCGTGLSTIALKQIARNIIGVDASAEMLALAPKEHGVRFLAARAEHLPFHDSEFNLVTLSQVFHWLDRDKFLPEAWRVLRKGGWVVAYDDYFSVDQMAEDPEFQRWFRKEYLESYPTPPRGELAFTAESIRGHGFRLLKEEWHRHYLSFSPEGLVDYLVTQSNVIASVEGGKEEIEETRVRLAEGVKPLFGDATEKEFIFNAPIWYLQRAS